MEDAIVVVDGIIYINIALCVAEWIYCDSQNYEGGIYWTL